MAHLRYCALALAGAMAMACSGEVQSGDTGPFASQDPAVSPTMINGQPGGPGGVSPTPGQPEGTAGPTPGVVTPPGTGVPTSPTVGPTPAVPVDPSMVPAAPLDLRGEPYYSRATQLTNEQWASSVQDLLNLETPPSQVESFLKPSGGFTLFPNNERVLEVTNTQRESYSLAASELAADLLANAGAVDRIGAGSDADTFVSTFGRRAFRRPLSADEVTRYRELFDVGAGLSGDATEFEKGASIVVEAMLQSPLFLYRSELAPTGQALTSYEVAAKLSFWILGTTPSEELLDRAEAGELDTPEGVAAVAGEMADAPEATDIAVSMFAEMFKFVRYGTIVKSVPEYTAEMGSEADEMSRRFFAHLYEQGQGLRAVLTSRDVFAGPALAPLYGLATQSHDTTVDIGDQRVGFFAQVPYLMLFGSDDRSDAIHRGLFLNFQVLCAELPQPDFELPEPGPADPDKTDRESVEALTGFNTCGQSCHGYYINPLGYAFENYDGMGRWRDMDKGKVVDSSSAYPLPEGLAEFTGAAELMEILADSQRTHQCFAKNIASFGLQRDIVADDQPLLDQLATISMSTDGSMKNLMVELSKTPAFRTREGASL